MKCRLRSLLVRVGKFITSKDCYFFYWNHIPPRISFPQARFYSQAWKSNPSHPWLKKPWRESNTKRSMLVFSGYIFPLVRFSYNYQLVSLYCLFNWPTSNLNVSRQKNSRLFHSPHTFSNQTLKKTHTNNIHAYLLLSGLMSTESTCAKTCSPDSTGDPSGGRLMPTKLDESSLVLLWAWGTDGKSLLPVFLGCFLIGGFITNPWCSLAAIVL